MAKGILGSKEVRWKWAVGNGVRAQGMMGCGVKYGVKGLG